MHPVDFLYLASFFTILYVGSILLRLSVVNVVTSNASIVKYNYKATIITFITADEKGIILPASVAALYKTAQCVGLITKR